MSPGHSPPSWSCSQPCPPQGQKLLQASGLAQAALCKEGSSVRPAGNSGSPSQACPESEPSHLSALRAAISPSSSRVPRTQQGCVAEETNTQRNQGTHWGVTTTQLSTKVLPACSPGVVGKASQQDRPGHTQSPASLGGTGQHPTLRSNQHTEG